MKIAIIAGVGEGKSTIAEMVAEVLEQHGIRVQISDPDAPWEGPWRANRVARKAAVAERLKSQVVEIKTIQTNRPPVGQEG